MAGLLTDTIREWASTPFDKETANCGVSVLRYMEQVTGRLSSLPVPDYDYITEEDLIGSQAIKFATDLGWIATMLPRRGDVGLIRYPGMRQRLCAICTGSKWISRADRGDRGVVIAPAHWILAWEAPK